jgi:hypothetical protein
MNKTPDQDDFRLRWSDLWAFVPMLAFTLLAAVLAAQQQRAQAAAQNATVTLTNAGERSLNADVAKHSK